MKVNKGDQITFVLRIEDPKQASKLCGDILNTMRGREPYSGVLAVFSARENTAKQRDEANQLLDDVAGYLSHNHLGDAKAEALLDRLANKLANR